MKLKRETPHPRAGCVVAGPSIMWSRVSAARRGLPLDYRRLLSPAPSAPPFLALKKRGLRGKKQLPARPPGPAPPGPAHRWLAGMGTWTRECFPRSDRAGRGAQGGEQRDWAGGAEGGWRVCRHAARSQPQRAARRASAVSVSLAPPGGRTPELPYISRPLPPLTSFSVELLQSALRVRSDSPHYLDSFGLLRLLAYE